MLTVHGDEDNDNDGYGDDDDDIFTHAIFSTNVNWRAIIT